MSLTKELVKEARLKLIDTVKVWMSDFDNKLSALQIETWIKAAKSNTSNDMSTIFQQERFPLLHQDNLEQIDDFFDEDEEIKSTAMIKKTYVCLYQNGDSFMYALSQLTNLVEYLFQLEKLLTPLETAQQLAQSLRPIKLAEEMAKSILNEWQFVEPGEESVNHYEARQLLVDKQLKLAEETTEGFIAMELASVTEQIQQFDHVVECLASNLHDLFAIEKDERFCVTFLGFRLRAYTHWHEILITLAKSLYEDVTVNSQNINTLEISKASLEHLKTSYDENYSNPVNVLNKELNSNLDQAKTSINAARRTINAMKSQVRSEEALGTDWRIKQLSMTTEHCTPYNFFKILKKLEQSKEAETTYLYRQ